MSESAHTYRFDVPDEALGSRVDAFLVRALPELSRSRLKNLIDAGHVRLEGAPTKSSRKLRGGEWLEVDIPHAPPSELTPQEMSLDVLFEDDDILVLDKPAGLVVHPGAGNPDQTLANALRARLPDVSIGGVMRPGIVHRLDKDTSGLMVVAKHDASHQQLTAAFKNRTIDKGYLAFCLGRPRESVFERVSGHRRDDKNRKRFTTRLPPPEDTSGGVRFAHSQFRLHLDADGVGLLWVRLLTGRTHQIRAHLADIGHPLLQDGLYGGGQAERRLREGGVRNAVARLQRHGLHAARLSFLHPMTQKRLDFEAPLPEDLARIERALRGEYPTAGAKED